MGRTMCPVVGLGALESRVEGVVDVDGVRRVLGAELLAEYLLRARTLLSSHSDAVFQNLTSKCRSGG